VPAMQLFFSKVKSGIRPWALSFMSCGVHTFGIAAATGALRVGASFRDMRMLIGVLTATDERKGTVSTEHQTWEK